MINVRIFSYSRFTLTVVNFDQFPVKTASIRAILQYCIFRTTQVAPEQSHTNAL